MKFSIKAFFSNCDQIRSFLRILSHLRKKSIMENFLFCAVMSEFQIHWSFFYKRAYILNFSESQGSQQNRCFEPRIIFIKLNLRKSSFLFAEMSLSVLKDENLQEMGKEIFAILSLIKFFAQNYCKLAN